MTDQPVLRGPGGRFAPGTVGGPGASAQLQSKLTAFRRVLLSTVTEADIAEITQQLIKLAKGGKMDAIEMMLKYSLGGVDGMVNAAAREAQEAVLNKSMEGGASGGHAA